MHMPVVQVVYCNILIHIRKDRIFGLMFCLVLFFNLFPVDRVRKKSVRKGLIKVIVSGFLSNMLKLRVISSCEHRRPILPISCLSTAAFGWVLEFPASLERNL